MTLLQHLLNLHLQFFRNIFQQNSNGMEYTNTITMSGTCTSWNGCGYEDSPTNTIIINDIASDYDITTRFSFSVPSQPNYHYAADVRNPELFVT